jgi:hypothetical protein
MRPWMLKSPGAPTSPMRQILSPPCNALRKRPRGELDGTHQVRDEYLLPVLHRHMRVRYAARRRRKRHQHRCGIVELGPALDGGYHLAVARAVLAPPNKRSHTAASGVRVLTFMIATWPVESGVQNAGPFPPELTSSRRVSPPPGVVPYA